MFVFCSFSDVPGAPTGPLTASDLTVESVTLTWRPPKHDGGSPITGYVVEKLDLDKDKSSWVRAARVSANETTTTVQNLTKDHRYNFRVCAENKIGAGETIDLMEPVKPTSGLSKCKLTRILQTFNLL